MKNIFPITILVGLLVVFVLPWQVTFAAPDPHKTTSSGSTDTTSGSTQTTQPTSDTSTSRTYQPSTQQGNIYNNQTNTQTTTNTTSQSSTQQTSQTTSTNASPASQSSLSVSQQARNLSAGQADWQSTVSANPLDVIEFQVMIKNISTKAVSGVTVKDTFDQLFTYIQDSLLVDGQKSADDVRSGISLDKIAPGQTVTINYQAQLGSEQAFAFVNNQPKTLNNTVTITRSGAQDPPDQALVSIVVTSADAAATTTQDNTKPKTHVLNPLTQATLASFQSVFRSVFGPSDVYQYVGLPKSVNILLIAVGIICGLASILFLTGWFDGYIKPLFNHNH